MEIASAITMIQSAGALDRAATDKIMEIATSCSKVVLEQFRPGRDERIYIHGSVAQEDGTEGSFNYAIYSKRLCFSIGRKWVLANRYTAVMFIRDVRRGLLEVVADCLLERSREAAAVLEVADDPRTS